MLHLIFLNLLLNLEKYPATLFDVAVFMCTDALVLFSDTLNERGDPTTLFHNKIKEHGKWKGIFERYL
jgi:hypothetical protein